MTDSTETPNDSNTTTRRILSELDNAIANLPLEKMIDSMKFPTGERSTPVHELEHVIEDRLGLLSVHARTGSEEAIRTLRNIGNSIASELEYLSDLARNGIEAKDESISPQKQSIDLGGSSPTVVRLRGDFSGVNEILSRESDAISYSSLESSCDHVSPGDYSARQAVVDVMDSLYWPDSFSEFIHYNFDSESVYCGHPEAKLERAEQIVKEKPEFSESERRGMISHIVIRDIIRKKIELKMPEYFRGGTIEKAKMILSESLTWPISTSAFSDNRNAIEKKLKLLSLGSALPFRLRPKGKAGASRKFKSGSYVAFALEYCIALHEIRRAGPANPSAHFEVMQVSETDLSNGLDSLPKIQEECTTPPNKTAITWTIQASLLPPFPSSGATPSEEEKLALKAWIEAAMARAEYICRTRWEDFGWPQCVEDRAGHDEKAVRIRTKKEAVREMLIQGMKKLQPNN